MKYIVPAFVTVAIFIASADAHASAEADALLEVHAYLIAEPRLVVSSTDISNAAQVGELSILQGDAVSLRIVLRNAGDQASIPTSILWGRSRAFRVRVTRPDASTVTAVFEKRGGSPSSTEVPLRPLQPSEEQVLDTFLYETDERDAKGFVLNRYLFDAPGEYTIHVEYRPGDLSVHDAFEQSVSLIEPPILRSLDLIVTVDDEAIPSWQQLKDAGIVDHIGSHRWPAVSTNNTSVQSAISAANRPWLSTWVAELEAPQQQE